MDVIVGWLVNGTRGTGFEQPTTESEAVAAGAIGEETEKWGKVVKFAGLKAD